MSDVAVSLRGLSRRYGETVAVDDLTFDVEAGRLFGLVGPDGAGKTTAMRMLAGILRPTAGDAVVHGVSVRDDPEGVKPHIAYMSQRFGLYTDLSVRENIEFYADLYQVPKDVRPKRLERLYAFSNLGPFEQRMAGQLSGGMKQKLSLCCALIHHPPIMLLDEPTFGVDPISRRDLWLIVHQMVAAGVTVIVTTAYLDEAERCDRVALLHHGRVIALDAPNALQSRIEGRVLSVTSERPREVRNCLREQGGVRATLFGQSVHVVLADAAQDWPRAARFLDDAGIPYQPPQQVPPSLEDAFMHLVEEPRDE
jgi:ABC-2 type transport system ATP-binding protein